MANELDQFNLTQAGTLPPELYAQQQQLNRQQQMAAMLMQQNQQPQGQMVSGRYVPTSFFQNLQPVANMLAGAYLAKQGDTKAAELADQIRKGKSAAEESILKSVTGYDKATELAGPYAGNVPMPTAVEKVAPDYAAALRKINDPYSYGAGADLKPLIYKQMMPEATPEEKRYKAAIADGSFKGGFNAFMQQMSDKDKASLAIDKARLGLAQQEFNVNNAPFNPASFGQGNAQVGSQGMPQGTQTAPTLPQPPAWVRTQKDYKDWLKSESEPLNEFQGKAVLFGSSMKQANNVIDSLSKEGTLTPAVAPEFLSGIAKLAPLGVGDAAANAGIACQLGGYFSQAVFAQSD
jgi:hypothetical protein